MNKKEWIQQTLLILNVQRVENSRDGNPRYELQGSVEGTNKVQTFLTVSNAMEVYMHDWHSLEGRTVSCEVKPVGIRSTKTYISNVKASS